jgi:hypothetical protein
VDTTFVVHRSAFGLPDMLFEMHPCGLHVCYPKNMGEFGFVQTVEDNMKLFKKRQIARAVQAQDFELCADEDEILLLHTQMRTSRSGRAFGRR